MRAATSQITDALAARRLVARDFLWIIAKDRGTGADVPDGMWSDVGPINADVIDPETGGTSTRSFVGSGTLVKIDAIPLVSDITVQTVNITLSQVSDHVNDLVRTYECRQARVQIFRGLFDPNTRVLVSPAPCRFVGFVDKIEIKTPAEDNNGAVVLTCVSQTQELTRSNPDTRSAASQHIRNPTDDFYNDAAVVGEWQLFWGKTSDTAA